MGLIASVVVVVGKAVAGLDMVVVAAPAAPAADTVVVVAGAAVDLDIDDQIGRSRHLEVLAVVPVVEAAHMGQNHPLAEAFVAEAFAVEDKVPARRFEEELAVAVGFAAPLLRPLQVSVL